MSHKEAVEADTSNSGERGGTRLGGPEKKAAAASGQGAKASPDQVIGQEKTHGPSQ